jgi:hypothetical protein
VGCAWFYHNFHRHYDFQDNYDFFDYNHFDYNASYYNLTFCPG